MYTSNKYETSISYDWPKPGKKSWRMCGESGQRQTTKNKNRVYNSWSAL